MLPHEMKGGRGGEGSEVMELHEILKKKGCTGLVTQKVKWGS